MAEDDEDNDCLLIDEDRTEPEQPVNANNSQLHATARNNADTSPSNIVSLLKNFNLERFRSNNPHIFDDANEETHQNIKQGKNGNGARVFCKDFARIPFDNSNLLTPEYLASSELYSHLVGNTNMTRSAADPVQFRNNGNSNDFRPTTNNFTNNARRSSDTFIKIPSPTDPFRGPQRIPSNTVYVNSDPKTGSVNINRLDITGNTNTNIALNRNGYGIRSENVSIGISAAQNLSHSGGPSTTAHRAEVSSNVDGLNGLNINNCLAPAMNMHTYGPVSIPPRQSQKLYASDANRRHMYGHDLAAPSANYGLNIRRCQCACCTGTCALIKRVTPTSALPTNYIPNMSSCTCPGSCIVHRSGPVYPTAQSNIQTPPNFSTIAPRNPYSQALNGNGAISREGLYRVEDPIRYANYQQAYLAEIRRNSNVAEQSTINTTRHHTVNNIPGPAMNQQPKGMAATDATRSCAQFNTNHINSDVINVDPGFPAISASYQEATRCGNSSNMITNSEASGIKNTMKNKRPTKTIMKTPKAKTKAVNKSSRAGAPTSKKNHLQLNNMNIATTLAGKQNVNLQQPTVEMRIPTELGEIKLAYNRSDANIMQAPLSYEPHFQNNMHNDIDQPQVNTTMQTIEQIIMDAVEMAMQNDVQQTENVTMYGKEQIFMSTETYKQDTLKRNVDSSLVLSNLNTSGTATSETLTSGPIVSASAKGFELRAPAPFTGVEVIRDKLESIDLTPDSGTRHDKMSMNIGKVQTPNTQQVGMNINSENAQIPLIMEACPQQAEISLNTDKAQININLLPKTQQETIPTSISSEASVQPANINTNVKSIQPPAHLNKNNLGTVERIVTTPWNSETAIQQSNTCNIEVPALSSTAKGGDGLYIDKTELESRPNMTMQTNLQQTRMGSHTETVQTSISMETSTQQTSNNTSIENVVALLTCVTQTSKTSNTYNLTYTTSSIESVTHNIENTDIASSFNNLNKTTGLMSSIPRSNTIYDTTQTQAIVQHHERDQTVDHISIDFLKSILHNVNRNATLQNTNTANTKISVNEPHANQACNNNISNIITDELPAVKEIKDHNEIYEDTETIKNEYATGTIGEGNIISQKSKSDEENNKLNIARQHLALLNMQNENKDVQPDPLKDNSRKNILDEYGSIISSVLKSLNISQTSYVSLSEQDKSVDSCITNRVRNSADVKSLETRKRKVQNDREIKKNKRFIKETNLTTSTDIKSLETRKRKILNDREINENSVSGSKKRYRHGADTKQNSNSSRPVQKPAANTGIKLQRTAFAKNQEKYKIIRKETNSYLVPRHHYEQKKFVDRNSCTTNTVRSFADMKSLRTKNRKIQIDRVVTDFVSRKAVDASKKSYRYGTDIKQKKNYTHSSRTVQKSALKLHQTHAAHKVKKNEIKEETMSTSRDEILFFNFQIKFFRHQQDRLMTENLRESADKLGDEIYKLIYKDAKADMEFECPKCHNVSIYSPRLLLYCKEDVHNLDESNKTGHCQHCIRFREKYKKSFVRFVKKNKKGFEKIIDDNSKNANTDDGTINSNDDLKNHAIEDQLNIIKNNAIADDDTIKSNNESKTQSTYTRTHSDSTHITDIGAIDNRPKMDTGSNQNITLTDDDIINSHNEFKTQSTYTRTHSDSKHSTDIGAIDNRPKMDTGSNQNITLTDDDIINSHNEFKTQSTYTRTHSDSKHSTDIGAIDNRPKMDTGFNQNVTLTDDDIINSHNEFKTQSTYTRTNSDSSHSTDIGAIDNRPKMDTGSNQNIALTDDDVINSHNEFKTQRTYSRINSDSTHSTDIEAIDNRPKMDTESNQNIALTDADTINSNNEFKTQSTYTIEEQLQMIFNGVPSFPTKANIDVRNNYSKIKLPVKLPCQMLKPSIVESLIKLKHDTTIESINNIDDKNKRCVMNLEVQQIVSSKPATGTSISRNKNLKTAIKNKDGNTENNEKCPVTIENADNNRNIDRSRKVSKLNDAETTTNINAKLPKRNANNSTDNAKNNVTQLINKDMNTANDDNKKNKISIKVRKSLSIETVTMCQRKINTGTNNNNHEKNNHKNCEVRKNFRYDTANRPNVEPKPKNSTGDVNKNTDSKKNKSSSSYRVGKATEKYNRIYIKLTKISGEHDKIETRRTNDKDEENYKRGEDDRKSSSNSDDNGSDSNETDDEINTTAKAVVNSLKTLKNNCNSNKKSELPQVHISGKEDKSSNEPKNYATVKDKELYKCHVCTYFFSYLGRYLNHMKSHGIDNEQIPKECVYKKCPICGLVVRALVYNPHISTFHKTIKKQKLRLFECQAAAKCSKSTRIEKL